LAFKKKKNLLKKNLHWRVKGYQKDPGRLEKARYGSIYGVHRSQTRQKISYGELAITCCPQKTIYFAERWLMIHAVLSVRESLKQVCMRCGAALQLQMFGGAEVWFFKNAVMKVRIF
jgi:hypothetical protein